MTILVMGVGNTLLTDEAAGPGALALFERLHGDLPGVRFLDAGTLSFTLADEIGAADALIVFDAARLKAEPGAVQLLEGQDMDDFVRSGKLTVHEVGLTDLLDMARMTGDLPRRRALVAIEPAEIGWGLELSPAVAAALPKAVEIAHGVVSGWIATSEEVEA
ncbi:HyaD/HybD family hydrogenase maturation endopeptidase [Celeribacter neptunius]|uniref:HyaD/HybD family hydrogenase maturation endopeptidase n=1 Tax=Celeribacter neptunius TaxID=588602 RepID=UPI001C43156B|nr:HyaD/HybD family hydrogenase maturation endopeptidase [Celeribacter neptunius]